MVTEIKADELKKRQQSSYLKDRGEQYVVMYRKTNGEEAVHGYAKTIDAASRLERSLAFDPDKKIPRIVDRHDPRICPYADATLACRFGATQKYDPDQEEMVSVPCVVCGATKVFVAPLQLDSRPRIVTID